LLATLILDLASLSCRYRSARTGRMADGGRQRVRLEVPLAVRAHAHGVGPGPLATAVLLAAFSSATGCIGEEPSITGTPTAHTPVAIQPPTPNPPMALKTTGQILQVLATDRARVRILNFNVGESAVWNGREIILRIDRRTDFENLSRTGSVSTSFDEQRTGEGITFLFSTDTWSPIDGSYHARVLGWAAH
jgi:hypothetical protein